MAVENGSAPVWQGITNLAIIPQGTNSDIVSNVTGNAFVSKFTEPFFFDADGNQISDSLLTNLWNGENRLIVTESANGVPNGGKVKQTWSHLADGRWHERVTFTWNGSTYLSQTTNRFVWDGKVLLAIVDHTNGLVMSFPRGLDLSGSVQGAGGVGGVLSLNVVTNGVHFAAYDGNGNLTALVSTTNATSTAQYEFSPVGEMLRATGPMAKCNPIRFSTQLADDLTESAKYLFRDYAPARGKWLSRDPIGEWSDLNNYTFTANASINKFDYLGLAITQIPAGQPGPPGYHVCGRWIFADGRKETLWCQPENPQPLPPWFPSGSEAASCPRTKDSACPPIADVWPDQPLDWALWYLGGDRKPACESKYSVCIDNCQKRYFGGKCAEYWLPCMNLCERLQLKCETTGSNGYETSPGAPKLHPGGPVDIPTKRWEDYIINWLDKDFKPDKVEWFFPWSSKLGK